MSVVLSMGHTLNMSIQYLDQNGNPMLTPPTPDSAPTWSNTTSATETLAPSSSGLACVGTPVAPGNDVVTVTLSTGGVTFTANLDVEVDPAAQVLKSIAIVSDVS